MKFFLKVSEKLIIFLLVAAVLTTSVYGATRITELAPEEYSNIIALVGNQTLTVTDGETVAGYIDHFLYKSSFAAIEGGIFPYPNKEDYTEVVEDGTYTVHGILAKGCYAYSKFVSYVMLGDFGARLYHNETKGALTVDGVRSFILKNVQVGEHIRLGTYHSVSFLSGDENGFYSLGYSSDNEWGGQKIELVYYTFEEFTQLLNRLSPESSANGRTLYVFDVQKEKNEMFDFIPDVSVILDGSRLEFDVQPQIINNRTYLPLRIAAEALGAQVSWEEETKTAIIEKEGSRLEFQVNNSVYKVNGKEVKGDAPALVSEGRTLVPIRCISESFSLEVKWEEETKCVILKTPEPVE